MSRLSRRELLATLGALASRGALPTAPQKPGVESSDKSPPRSRDPASEGWIATWASSTWPPLPPVARAFRVPFTEGFENQTLRQCVFTSVGGNALRVRISNRYGKQPLRIAKAACGAKAALARDAEIIAGTITSVTFSGSQSVSIPPGREIASDAVRTTVLPHQTLAIDLYFPDKTGTPESSFHPGLTYLADGDRAGAAAAAGFSGDQAKTRGDMANWYYLRGVDVRNTRVKDVIVCGADSLSHSTRALDGHVKWPQILSRRLRAEYGDTAPSVVQSTLMGNRLLTSGPVGPSVLERFESDLLSQPGTTKVILWAGFNDLVYPNLPQTDWTGPRPVRNVDDLIGGYRTLVEKAHARGIKIYGCTMAPGRDASLTVEGKPVAVWSGASEMTRLKLNDWFRSSGAQVFDGVFDFAAAVENPLDRASYDPSCSEDGVHPSAGGHYAIAHAIDIRTLMM